ncbi:NAD(P)-binding oxidoreductase [Aeromicrobium sp. UC242_57]|uniref:NAD(P)-binding oxidoreductase n=1 Tax=Aeromicrobium sp. UC242_57 TaxID=3374624 RepID=UPI0037A0CA1A
MGTIAVLGAGSGTGRHVAEQALAGGHNVTAIVRDAHRTAAARPCLEVRQLDIANSGLDEMRGALLGASAVVFAAAGDLRRVDHLGVVLATHAAEDLGIERFVLLSAKGAGVARPNILRGGFWDDYFAAKEAAEAKLQQSGLAWTIIKPGELTDEPACGRIALGEEIRSTESISRADVAATILTALDHPGSVKRKWELVGGNASISEAVRDATRLAVRREKA